MIAIGDEHIPVGVKGDACRRVQRACGNGRIAGRNRNRRSARSAESDLQDLVEVSVTNIKVGAGVIDGKRLREAYALAAEVQQAGRIRCIRLPGNLDDPRRAAGIGNVDVATEVEASRGGKSGRIGPACSPSIQLMRG